MQFKQHPIPSSKYSKKSPKTVTMKYLVVHNTANNAPALNEAKYCANNDSSTSFHLVVDEKECYQLLPFNRMAHHAGSATYNGNSIGLEIARSTSSYSTYLEAEANGAIVAAKVLKQHGWGVSRLKTHKDCSGKHCPHRMLDNNRWGTFKNMVQKELDKLNESSSGGSSSKGDFEVGDKVKIKSTATSYATGEKISSYAKNLASHTVKQVDGNKVLLSEITSWVWLKDLTLVGSIAVKSKVKINSNADKYATNQTISSWAKTQVHTVAKIDGKKALLKEINSWCWISDLHLSSGSTTSTPKPKPIKVGGKCKIKSSASKYATGQSIPSSIKSKTHTIQQIKSDRVLLKEIVSWVYKKDISMI